MAIECTYKDFDFLYFIISFLFSDREIEGATIRSAMVLCLQEINKKIISLNFNDCHAKIRQVDSQATVGNAVVVQVSSG